jgi:NADH dehydrogenase [ubiquinone] 1 alpha subcomplex assembly factor 5
MVADIFDTSLFKLRQNRRFQTDTDYNFLYDWSVQQIKDRMSVITRDFESVIHLGARDNSFVQDFKNGFTLHTDKTFSSHSIGDESFLPIKTASQDLIVSTLNLHRMNDVPGALIQIKRALKPDGLFLGVLFGGETLSTLRECLTETEIKHHGGVSPRIFPFADKQDCGALMQRAGFALPVIDSEIITVSYTSLVKMLHDLRGMNESNTLVERNKNYVGHAFFNDVEKAYRTKTDNDSKYMDVKFEMIFLLGWAPHDSQQKPLMPGSATGRLADVLGTEEIKTGETPS